MKFAHALTITATTSAQPRYMVPPWQKCRRDVDGWEYDPSAAERAGTRTAPFRRGRVALTHAAGRLGSPRLGFVDPFKDEKLVVVINQQP